MSTILKPSPNETSRMLHDEFQRRRQTRILQVREQEKKIAMRIRRAIQEKQQKEMENLKIAVEREWKQKHKEDLKEFEQKYASGLKEVGTAHKMAVESERDQALTDAMKENLRKAARERGKCALEHERELRRNEEKESMAARKRRHMAMIKEKLRARHVARLPPPAADPADTFLDNTVASQSWSSSSGPSKAVRFATIEIKDHNSTMPTVVSLGQASDAVVERATAEEASTDARKEAEREGERINLLQAERDKEIEERMEKAKVRHQAALEKARLEKESQNLMDDLKQMKMKDALRRQYHIEYTWKDSAKMQQACNDLFRPARLPESQLLSQDLTRQEDEELSEDQDDFDGCFSTKRTLHPLLEEAEEEESGESNERVAPTRGKALNKLLKQIENQREQRKKAERQNDTRVESLIPQSLNGISSIVNDRTEDNSSTTPDDSLDETPQYQDRLSAPEHTDPKKVYAPSPVSIPPAITAPPKQESPIKPKTVTQLKPLQNLPQPTSLDSTQSSESLLTKSLESVKQNDALLKSVKDFQQRILQQHKSYAKIQHQIERLQEKKENLDGIVSDITKPKGF